MLFWWAVIIALVAYFISVFGDKMYYNTHVRNNEVLQHICMYSEDIGKVIAFFLSVICGIMVLIILITMLSAPGNEAKLNATYDHLVYQLENDMYTNDNDLGKKDLFDDILAYNKEVIEGKTYQHDYWVGIFYPNIYDQMKLIDYASVRGDEGP